jgi:hypothetical protein
MSRALLIACQYANLPQYSLYGCFNDIDNIKKRLLSIDPKMQITVMKDNLPTNSILYPTATNIITQFTNLTKSSESTLFFYYSGHGTYANDINRDELAIGYNINGIEILRTQSYLTDSCLVANNINNLQFITDDTFSTLLQNLKTTQTMYAFMDSCNSGTGMDLAYVNMAKYMDSFTSITMTNLQKEITQKCSIVSSNYPNKIGLVKGSVILISGTRDKDYSYEGTINGISSGYFTSVLCTMLDTNISTITLKQFYLNLVALLNQPFQVPVLTSSLNLNLDNIFMSKFKVKPKIKIRKALESNVKNVKDIISYDYINMNGLLRLYLTNSINKRIRNKLH